MNAKESVHLVPINIHIRMEGRHAVNALINSMNRLMEIQQAANAHPMHT